MMQSQTAETSRNTLVGSALVLLAAVTVSSKAVMVKLAYAYGVDAESLIALRMAFAMPFFAALAVWAWRREGQRRIERRDAWLIVLLGVAGGYAPMWFDFAGLAYVSAGLERVILFLYPTMVVLISAVLFGQRIGRREIFALVASYAGVALAVGHDLAVLKSGAAETLLGAVLVMISALTYAGYLVCSGRVIPRVGTVHFTAYSMLVAGIASAVHFAVTPHAVAITELPAQQARCHHTAPVERGQQSAEHLVAADVVECRQHGQHVLWHHVWMRRQRGGDLTRSGLSKSGADHGGNGQRLGARPHLGWQALQQRLRGGKLSALRPQQRRLEDAFGAARRHREQGAIDLQRLHPRRGVFQ